MHRVEQRAGMLLALWPHVWRPTTAAGWAGCAVRQSVQEALHALCMDPEEAQHILGAAGVLTAADRGPAPGGCCSTLGPCCCTADRTGQPAT
jgi:hypothetical protein